ncbi:hypothetical protein HBI56_038280 [Parastagonospora nodorum]|uniref:Uncharacterized protein n=1 Tax=Phaeosphaeria nodorum (strain SN15 / ATCC MYA-4574 / FGSC 10173) TaxID=321614 RepID=A0A7U2EYY3_PHANO|nr:hypothetical protein HBH56_068530 [Parastagonospora nodorum]QRC93514.1 hypothetical protein JI435_403980 [Parastagonospora nodorum SN15]KAH3932319.1 hypothetical protein HBH54_079600 [Parastagonospora nodorum]KAH3955067.1 hypothetical protein HBH53_014770 [Parastagonospora nodorum]KAH3986561.1 hypothetical protein HBH52_045930 [Parastagonospora nodorum]
MMLSKVRIVAMCLCLSHRPSYTICSRVYYPNRRVKFEEGIPRGFFADATRPC